MKTQLWLRMQADSPNESHSQSLGKVSDKGLRCRIRTFAVETSSPMQVGLKMATTKIIRYVLPCYDYRQARKIFIYWNGRTQCCLLYSKMLVTLETGSRVLGSHLVTVESHIYIQVPGIGCHGPLPCMRMWRSFNLSWTCGEWFPPWG